MDQLIVARTVPSHIRLPEPPAGLGAMRAGGPMLAAALFVALIVAIAAQHVVLHPLAMLTPTAFVIAAGTDIATMIILLAIGRYSAARASTLLLAALFANFALIALVMLLCIPLDPGSAPLLPVGSQAAPYLFISWKVLSGLGGFAYAFLRRAGDDERSSLRAVEITVAAIAAAAVSLTLAIGFAGNLPAIVAGTAFTPIYCFVYTPITIVLCLAAAISVFRTRGSNAIDRAFAYAILAAAFQAALSAIGGQQYTVPWYLARLVYTGAETIVLISAVRTLIESREILHSTEAALKHSERESRRHADRIRALWEIAADHACEEARLQDALDLGGVTLRPGNIAVGYLCSVQESALSIEAASAFAPGTLVDLDGAALEGLFPGGRCAWNDLADVPEAAAFSAATGFRAVIGTALLIGRKTYVLVFGWAESMQHAPFAEDDIAFVDVLAAFISHQFAERAQRERIQYQIEHDALTGLNNRSTFRAALRRYVNDARPFAVAFVDLDNFRAINETSGHLIGDELLVEIAVGLRGIDERDFVAPVAGDGFAIILSNAGTRQEAHARLAAYANLFERPFHTGDRDGTRMLGATASFGLAYYPGDATTADELLRAADIALDAAKERGGARIVVYDAGMNESLRQRYVQTLELAEALDAGHLSVAYQPTFALDECRITGAEALVRWNHPTRGLLLPCDFVPFAEKNGLIGRLTRFVMDRVISDLGSLPALPPGFRCYFNLASAQIGDLGFIADLERSVRANPQIAGHLGVEITETAAITNLESSIYALDRFRKLGLRIAIDDFGTGYSSLSYLKRLPIDVIKIDRSFVTGLPDDAKDVALCELLLQIASRFDLIPLAEGIETEAQLQWLREHDCDFGQGFLISKPIAFEGLVSLLPGTERQNIAAAGRG